MNRPFRSSSSSPSFRSSWSLLVALLVTCIASSSAHAQTANSYDFRILQSFSSAAALVQIAVDPSGNVYAGDDTETKIYEILAVNGVVPSNPVTRTLAAGINSGGEFAVDKYGDVFTSSYVGDTGNSLYEILAVNGSIPATPTIRTLTTTDRVVDMYADTQSNLDIRVTDGNGGDAIIQVESVNGVMPANPVTRVLFTEPQGAHGLGPVTTDAASNVYYFYSDQQEHFDVYKLNAVNGVIPDNPTPQALMFPAYNSFAPDGSPGTIFAVDPKGNMFFNIYEADNQALAEIKAVNGTIPPNAPYVKIWEGPTNSFYAEWPTVDANDNVFITGSVTTGIDQGYSAVAEFSVGGVTLTPSSYNYGSVDVSSSANETFTLANTGTSSINITSTSFSNKVFSTASTTCGSTLAAAASCTYKVEFAPTAVGTQLGAFAVTYTPVATLPETAGSVGPKAVAADSTLTATLTGTGVAVTAPTAPAAALTPSSQDFGSETVGSSSAAKTFSLTNAGTAALPISSVAINGTNVSAFTLGTNGCGTTLAAGASCTISIAFTPVAAGSDSASLTVIDSVGTQTSTLTGTAAAVVNPDFAIAATPSTQTIAAGGTADYAVSITPSGGFDSAVALKATGLPPGGTVTFSPASVTPGSGAASSTMAIHVASLTTVGANTSGSSTPWKIGGSALAAVFLFLPFRRLRKWRGMLCAFVFSATLLAMGGCGGGFGYGARATAATYTVTITGTSGALTHSTTVQLTVDFPAQAAE